jgi:molecular chaperone DnaK (HSP70)
LILTAHETNAALDQAVAVLQGGVERPGMEGALRVIEIWEQRLAASESPELLSVADNLAALRIQLLAGDSEPAAVGRLLVTLGEQVGSVATSDIGTPVADRLSQLSALLTDGGNTLANR